MATFMGSYTSKLWGLGQAGCVWNTQHTSIAGTELAANSRRTTSQSILAKLHIGFDLFPCRAQPGN